MSVTATIEPVEALREAFAALVEAEARRGIADRGIFTIAVPGGSAAEALLPRLVRATVDWRHAEVFWVDERAVGSNDPDANVRVARAGWIDRVAIPVDRVHPMPGDAADLGAAARSYEGTMRRVLGNAPAIDVVLLGMGPDGHVASLFPGHPLLDEASAWAVAVGDSPKPPPRRLTLTLPVLRAARHLAVFATGAAKAGPIGEAWNDPSSRLPVALVARGPARVTFLLDPEAGVNVVGSYKMSAS